MRVALAQMNPVVGDFEGNFRQIIQIYERASNDQADLCVFPELALCGYPPHDLLDRSEFLERNEYYLEKLSQKTQNSQCALVVGYAGKNKKPFGRSAQNNLAVFYQGKRVFEQSKSLLPTYDVFDEARYFDASNDVGLWEFKEQQIGFAICEDLWAEGTQADEAKRLYERDLADELKSLGATLVISLSASPYEWGKAPKREELHCKISKKNRVPLIYVNCVGATDEILFDGGSFICVDGKLSVRLKRFETDYHLADLSQSVNSELSSTSEIESLAKGLVHGIQEYFSRTGFSFAVLGLSGGIDSAVVAALAAQALGKKNVLGIAMPGQYSSSHSLADAETLASRLGIQFEVLPIKFFFANMSRELGSSVSDGELSSVAQENLQARLRGIIVMSRANHYGGLALATGNKSELAMGYCTLYGDMAGAIAPIGDLLKTRVYELAHYINTHWGNPIPASSIEKEPSAELRPEQKDSDTLPEYSILDALLADYIEQGKSVDDLAQKYSTSLGEERVKELIECLEQNEYKRRQAALVLKTCPKAFGIGRRFPVAKVWKFRS